MKHPALLVLAALAQTALAQSALAQSAQAQTAIGQAMAPAMPPASAQTPSPAEPVGTDQSPGSAPPPPVVHDSPADRYFDPQAMAAAQAAAMAPAPGYNQLRIDLAEYQFRKGHGGYRWEGEAWAGDLNRFVLRSKGEGSIGHGLDSAELQGIYSLALDPWWNLQGGIRQDIRPTPARSYATIGIEGLAPYKFDILVAAFLSDKGQLTGRIETTVDERLTQRFVLQPRMELDFSAQNMPAQRLGAGLNSAELGLRLRYEITRQFAPYAGFSYSWAVGRAADYVRLAGDSPHQRAIVIGVRSWF